MLKLVQNTDNYYRFFVDGNKNAIGQFALVDQGKKKELKIVAFGIYGEYRDKGFGQQMLKEAIVEANRIRGDRALTLNVLPKNYKAIHIYKKYGFEVIGESDDHIYTMMHNVKEQRHMKVDKVERMEVRPFYDSRWLVRFDNGLWCTITRYDTDNADDFVPDIEACHSVDEVKEKVDMKNHILYD